MTSTRSIFVRGEEILNAWKPRGVSLVEEYYKLLHTERVLADVVTTGAVLSVIPSTRLIPSTIGQLPETRLWTALQLWQTCFADS